MAAKTVVIGCRLPHGLVIHHPMKPSEKVTLKGENEAVIKGVGYATTEVDADFWADWKLAHKDFAPLVSGAIFEAKSEAEAKAVAKELKAEKTGFEGMSQDGAGIKPADNKE